MYIGTDLFGAGVPINSKLNKINKYILEITICPRNYINTCEDIYILSVVYITHFIKRFPAITY